MLFHKPLLKFCCLMALCSLSFSSMSQEIDCDCQSEIQFLHQKIEKSPAYNTNKQQYLEVYEEVKQRIKPNMPFYDCYGLMTQLILSLNDHHISITANASKDQAVFTQEAYKSYPAIKRDIDSLIQALEAKSLDDIEGIYKSGSDGIHMALYFEESQQAYIGLVTKSLVEHWKVGEIMYKYLPYGNGGNLLGYGRRFGNKAYGQYRERISRGMISRLGLRKDNSKPSYYDAPHPDTTYWRKEIAADIAYLKVGSFSAYHNKDLNRAKKFYSSIEGKLSKKHLIIDIRGNGGGGDRNSNILLKMIKEHLKKDGKVYLLINQGSVSNAEHFAQRLSKLSGCTLLGDRSAGAAGYEITDDSFPLPCSQLNVILPMKKRPSFLPLEGEGVSPDILLDLDKDWIEQTVEYIRNK